MTGGIDLRGTIDGSEKNDGVDGCLSIDVDIGKSWVRDYPLDTFVAFHASGQAFEKEKIPLDSVSFMEKILEGHKVYNQKSWSSLFGNKPKGKSSFPPVIAKSF